MECMSQQSKDVPISGSLTDRNCRAATRESHPKTSVNEEDFRNEHFSEIVDTRRSATKGSKFTFDEFVSTPSEKATPAKHHSHTSGKTAPSTDPAPVAGESLVCVDGITEFVSKMSIYIFKSLGQCLRAVLFVGDIVVPLAQQFLSSFGFLFATTAKILIIVALGMANVVKYAAKEMEENDGAFFCYLVLYLVPPLCDLLMSNFSLPHYTPHLVSMISLYLLCHQPGQVVATSNVRRTPKSRMTTDRWADDICKVILRTLRLSIPFDIIVEGFSEPNISLMMLDVITRLLLAYVLSMMRANLILSPVAWVSWSVQVLISVYFPTNLVTEAFLLLIGLASVRLSCVVQLDA